MKDHINPLPAVGIGLGDYFLALDVGFIVCKEAIPGGEGREEGEMSIGITCSDDVIYTAVVASPIDKYILPLPPQKSDNLSNRCIHPHPDTRDIYIYIHTHSCITHTHTLTHVHTHPHPPTHTHLS